MTKPTMLQVPKVTVPAGSANDYACGSYNGNKNFSCTPYGNKGNIDANKSFTNGSDWAIGFISTVISGVIAVVVAT